MSEDLRNQQNDQAAQSGGRVDMPVRPRVYEMNDYDWWADYSEAAANENYRKWQLEQVGLSPEECEDDKAIEVSDEKMKELVFVTDDAKLSFENELSRRIDAGESFPCLFASTEY